MNLGHASSSAGLNADRNSPMARCTVHPRASLHHDKGVGKKRKIHEENTPKDYIHEISGFYGNNNSKYQ
jgi:hypothetical protein